jgi:hypothetical protein
MTYKNIKFSESDVMKEFEKIALDKKIIQPKIKKKASKIEISANLDVNICNLINKLSESGNFSLAEEVRSNFLEYKKAQVEDAKNELKMKKLASEVTNDMKRFYDSAHPEGSVKVDDDSESVVEDLYDSHDAIMKIVNKVNLKKKANLIKKANDPEYYEKKVNAILNQMYSLISSEISKIQAAKDSNIYSDSEKSSKKNEALTNRAMQFLSRVKNITNTFGGLGSGFVASNITDPITQESIGSKITTIINQVHGLYNFNDPEVSTKFPDVARNIQNIIESSKIKLNQVVAESNKSGNNTVNLGEFNTNSPDHSVVTDLGEVNVQSTPESNKMYSVLNSWTMTNKTLKASINQARQRLNSIIEEDNSEDAEWVTKSEEYINALFSDASKIDSLLNTIANEAYDDDNQSRVHGALNDFGFSGEALNDFNNLLGFRKAVNEAKANLGAIK